MMKYKFIHFNPKLPVEEKLAFELFPFFFTILFFIILYYAS